MDIKNTHRRAPFALLGVLVALGCANNQPFDAGATSVPATRTAHSGTSTTATTANSGQISGEIPTASPSAQASASPAPSPGSTIAPVTVSSVSVSPGDATLDLAGSGSGSPVFPSAVQLSAIVYLSDGTSTNSVTWSTDASATVGVSSGGLVTALAAGSAHVIASAGGTSVATATASIVVQTNGVVGVTID